jgi:hypothetical protein
MTCRVVGFAGSSVVVEFNDPRAADLLDFIIFNQNETMQTQPQVTFRLEISDEKPPRYVLHQGAVTWESQEKGSIAETLLGNICRELAKESRGGLLIHAGMVSMHGKGILLPGGIGAGKSTFTALCLKHGMDYLTDELVFIPQGSFTGIAFGRPLHLKHPSRAVLDYGSQMEKVFTTPFSDLVPPVVLNPEVAKSVSEAPLRLVLFPNYQPEGDYSWQLLSTAHAGLELMQCVINVRNLPEFGFDEVVRISRAVPMVRIAYQNFEQIEEDLKTCLAQI